MYDQNNAIPLQPPANALISLPGRNASNSASPSSANMMPNIFTNPSIQPSSVINLTSSSDVVIGPMTQYQGPVNIYQYMDATVEARAMHANGGIRQNTTNESTTVLQRAQKNSTILIVILFTVLVGAGVAVYYIYKTTSDNNIIKQNREILFGNNYESGTIPNLGNGHLVIDRKQWGASEYANISYTLEHPIPYVLITHVGVQSTPCFNVYKCSIKMRTIQDSAIAERGLPDITSNFYVGNDGNVYVGRGWNQVNTYANKSLAITFMGDYIRSEPDPQQLEAVQFLLSYGITQKYIALDYKLVAQNQTRKSKSPGTNVYKHVSKWPHFYPCGMNGNPRCGVELGLPDQWDPGM